MNLQTLAHATNLLLVTDLERGKKKSLPPKKQGFLGSHTEEMGMESNSKQRNDERLRDGEGRTDSATNLSRPYRIRVARGGPRPRSVFVYQVRCLLPTLPCWRAGGDDRWDPRGAAGSAPRSLEPGTHRMRGAVAVALRSPRVRCGVVWCGACAVARRLTRVLKRRAYPCLSKGVSVSYGKVALFSLTCHLSRTIPKSK